jgi:phospholipid transport system transporter-binding protein
VIVCGSGQAATAGAFTVSDDGAHWSFEGRLTMDDAAHALAVVQALPLPTSGIVDLAGLSQADSAALAVLIALKRRAAAEGRHLTLVSLPAALHSLAVVYGVEELVVG